MFLLFVHHLRLYSLNAGSRMSARLARSGDLRSYSLIVNDAGPSSHDPNCYVDFSEDICIFAMDWDSVSACHISRYSLPIYYYHFDAVRMYITLL
ncbi:hypothetical protein VTO73DRAFT_11952 [Trametes versicolor]